MSEENVAVVRAAIDAMNRRDFDGLSRCLTADAEYDFSRAIGLQQGIYDRAQLRGCLYQDEREALEAVGLS